MKRKRPEEYRRNIGEHQLRYKILARGQSCVFRRDLESEHLKTTRASNFRLNSRVICRVIFASELPDAKATLFILAR